jgi:peptide chain release factor subunit 1
LKLLEKIYNSGLVTVTVKEKKEIKTDKEFYDLHVPGSNTFVANGIVVHNSQGRYDRIREDAINEFLTKVGEIASKTFLEQPELKGIIIGGPGPIKNTFVDENYLHYQLRPKVLGVKDIGYTDEYGLEQMVKRSEDLLQEAAFMKERQLMEKFFGELQKEGNVVYGFTETMKALNLRAVDVLLVSEDFDWVRIKLKCETGHTVERDLPKAEAEKIQLCEICGKEMKIEEMEEMVEVLAERAKEFGSRIEIISTETTEGKQFKGLGGIGGFLRYKID